MRSPHRPHCEHSIGHLPNLQQEKTLVSCVLSCVTYAEVWMRYQALTLHTQGCMCVAVFQVLFFRCSTGPAVSDPSYETMRASLQLGNHAQDAWHENWLI